MKIDAQSHRYPSVRNVVFAKHGMACSTQPLVSSIGIQAMAKGGNAIDAAIAMAGAMPVIEPACNGIGGDAFALIWTEGKLYGLNASGICPMNLTADAIRARGFDKIPLTGWTSTIVPGAPKGWAMAHKRFGTLPLKELWAPAIKAGREGFPIQPNVEHMMKNEWVKICDAAKRDGMAPYQGWFDTFTHDGTWYKAGELLVNPDIADTLEELAETECESFYHGKLADAICDFSDKTGGFFQKSDFENYEAMWVEPISVNYRGYDVYEIPPNGHGITTLMALNILNGFDLGNDRNDPEVWHKMIEAMKLAFIDTRKYVADPRFMKTKVEDMLSERYASERRALIGDTALYPVPGNPSGGDTVYFCTADDKGNMVSWIHAFRKRHSRTRNQHRASGQSHGLLHGSRERQFRPGRKAQLSHHNTRLPLQGRKAHRTLRRHGRIHAAPGPSDGRCEHRGLPHESSGSPRLPQIPVGGREKGAA